jgi:DNA gyrase subunit A
VTLCLVTTSEQFMCITNGGQVIRTEVSQVREVGRNTQGVRVIRLDESERVVDVAKLAERDDALRATSLTPPLADESAEPAAEPAASDEPEEDPSDS